MKEEKTGMQLGRVLNTETESDDGVTCQRGVNYDTIQCNLVYKRTPSLPLPNWWYQVPLQMGDTGRMVKDIRFPGKRALKIVWTWPTGP